MIPIDDVLLRLAGTGFRGVSIPPRSGWSERLNDVNHHGLAGLLERARVDALVDLDEQTVERLNIQLDAEAIRAVRLEGELIRMLPVFAELPVVVLRGAVLAHGSYPDPQLRPFTDLDLLVASRDLDRAVDALRGLGYARARPELASGLDAPGEDALTLVHSGGVIVKLHQALAAGDIAPPIGIDELLRRRITVPVGPVAVPAPTWEAHLVAVTVHAVVGERLRRALSIRDVAQLALHPDVDPKEAVELARRWQVSSLFNQGLRAAADAFQLHPPAPAAIPATALLGRPAPSQLVDLAGEAADPRLSPQNPRTLVLRSGSDKTSPPEPRPRQRRWSDERPPRRTPAVSSGGGGEHPPPSGPTGVPPAEDEPDLAHRQSPVTTPPGPTAVPMAVAGTGLLLATALASQLGVNRMGVVSVPLAGILLAVAMSRHIRHRHPNESWVGRWLVAGVLVKLTASYLRYLSLKVSYQGVGDATDYDGYGRQFAQAWLHHGTAPELTDLRRTNFLRWFTGVVYYLFGSNMIAGFFVFGLLALVGSYLWYRATVEAVPAIDKRLYLALMLFAPSVVFWPSSIGKESLMQLGIGVMAIGTGFVLRQRLVLGLAILAPGGWLLWVVRPHLLALVSVAAGCAYLVGRVRSSDQGVGYLLSRPVGLLVITLLVAFTVSQGAKFLGIESLSVSSIERELDQQTEASAQGGSRFDNGGNSLNPLYLPRGAVTVLLRPFPWETDTSTQLLASLESALLAGLLVVRLPSLRRSITDARSSPFLLYCWTLTILYCMTFSSFANFGLLVRQRSLVLPALLVLVSVTPGPARARHPVVGAPIEVPPRVHAHR